MTGFSKAVVRAGGGGQLVGTEGDPDRAAKEINRHRRLHPGHDPVAHDAQRLPGFQHPQHLQGPSHEPGGIDDPVRGCLGTVLEIVPVHIPRIAVDEQGNRGLEIGQGGQAQLP
jgi:hypothetical protein